ncbi:LLM class flavin-dependent oxidoreductase [Streptomyces sp. NPDC020096]
MEFGISLLPDAAPDTRPATAYFDDVLALCRYADAAGFSHVKMTEHYLHPYGGYCPSPLAFLAAVAARTRRIRLMTGCVLPVFHHPLSIASQAAMVDAISGGRLEVGFARAYLPYEFAALNVPMDGSLGHFRSCVDTVVRLWREEAVDADTPYFSFSGATALPRPTQTPHPPVLVAAVRTPESFEWIGERGYGLLITPTDPAADARHVRLYRRAFEAHHGHSEARPRVVASLPLYVHDSAEEAARIADHHLERYLKVWTSATDAWDEAASPDYARYTGIGRYLRTLTAADLRAVGGAIVGTPDHVAARIREFDELIGGVDSILWQTDYGDMPYGTALASLRLFAEQVMPRVTR